MKFIDLSRELYHRTPPHPSHPPIVIGTWYDHDEVKIAGETRPAPLCRGVYRPQQHRRKTDQRNSEGGLSGRCGGALWGQ